MRYLGLFVLALGLCTSISHGARGDMVPDGDNCGRELGEGEICNQGPALGRCELRPGKSRNQQDIMILVCDTSQGPEIVAEARRARDAILQVRRRRLWMDRAGMAIAGIALAVLVLFVVRQKRAQRRKEALLQDADPKP